MHETPDELAGLQTLIDASFARAGTHTTSIISADRRLSAQEVAAYLTGMKHLAVATVTASGEPRVGAVDGLFLHGRFWFSTSADAWRIKHLQERPAVSATHFVGDDIAITVHGTAHLVVGGTPEADALRPTWQAVYDGGSPEDWVPQPSLARYVRIDADRMLTYCFDRSKLESLMGES
jgi:general stress protein 26